MKRRTFIVGLGATAAGGTAVLGSGAFSSVEAERTVTVETVDDDEGYLQLEPTGVFGRSSLVASPIDDPDSSKVLKFRIPGPEEDEDLDTVGGGDGIGLDSRYFFGELVDARNAGTQTVEVTTEFDDPKGSITDVDLFTDDDGTRLRNNPVTLEVGDEERLGLYLETDDTELGEFNLTLTILAEAMGDEE